MTTQLTIPPKAKITEVGLTLPGRMDYGEWLATMGGLFQLERATRWSIGDGLAYGEQEYGEKYAQAMALSEATGINVDSLRQSQWVSEQVAPERRRPNLSWSHHREVSAQDPDVQERLLAAAEENEWSVSRLKEAVRTYKRALEAPEEFEDDEEKEEGEPEQELVPHGTTPGEHPSAEDAAAIAEYGEYEEEEVDPYEEWDREREANEKLHATIESMQADDKAAEIAKLHARIAGIEGRLDGETNAKNDAIKLTKYYQRLLGDIKDALGVDDNKEIKPAILKLLQGSARPAPAPKPKREPEEAGVELFRDGASRQLRTGSTLVVAQTPGIHSGDHLRVVRIDVPAKQVGVATWGDSDHEEIGTIAFEDLGWSQQKGAFITQEVAWAEVVPG